MARTFDLAKFGETIITGCSTGIGRALALELHGRGYRVLATARRLESLDDLAARGIAVARLDVTDQQSIDALDLAAREIGMLINNAGYGAMGAMVETSCDELRRQFETNVVATLAMVRAVVPAMLRVRRGRIANVSSISGVLVTPFSGAYCASKAAVNAMSDALRLELAPFGIDVVTVQPGAVRSSFGDTASTTIDRDRVRTGPYAPVAAAIEARAMAGQRGAIGAERFARIAIDALVRRNAPALVRAGPHSTSMPAMRRWLPPRILDAYLSRRFGLNGLYEQPRGIAARGSLRRAKANDSIAPE